MAWGYVCDMLHSMNQRYPIVSDDFLRLLVGQSRSVAEVVRNSGRRVAGGTHANYSKRIARLGIDTSHFQSASTGGLSGNGNKLTPEEIFSKTCLDGRRVSAAQLRRALLETGVEYKCVECVNQGSHNGLPLRLEVDHINGDWAYNAKENLRFLCPNCHTQTATYGKQQLPVG